MENQTGLSEEALPSWGDIKPTKPTLKWEVGQERVVEFLQEEPGHQDFEREEDGEKKVQRAFLFDVKEGDREAVIMTSSKFLLQGIKGLEPLKGKKARISKQMRNGKQFYSVEEV